MTEKTEDLEELCYVRHELAPRVHRDIPHPREDCKDD